MVGGLIWYAWHLPLALVIPQAVQGPLWQSLLNFLVLAIGSLCTFVYLVYVYVKSRSVWVTALAHIALNNSASSYFAVIRNQTPANIGLALTMAVVVTILYFKKELDIFPKYFYGDHAG